MQSFFLEEKTGWKRYVWSIKEIGTNAFIFHRSSDKTAIEKILTVWNSTRENEIPITKRSAGTPLTQPAMSYIEAMRKGPMTTNPFDFPKLQPPSQNQKTTP